MKYLSERLNPLFFIKKIICVFISAISFTIKNIYLSDLLDSQLSQPAIVYTWIYIFKCLNILHNKLIFITYLYLAAWTRFHIFKLGVPSCRSVKNSQKSCMCVCWISFLKCIHMRRMTNFHFCFFCLLAWPVQACVAGSELISTPVIFYFFLRTALGCWRTLVFFFPHVCNWGTTWFL